MATIAASEVIGVAPDTELVSLRVGENDGVSLARVMCALDWIAGQDLHPSDAIVNLSVQFDVCDLSPEPSKRCLGKANAEGLRAALDQLRHSTNIVAAAGNNVKFDDRGCPVLPAGKADLSVGGANWLDEAGTYSANGARTAVNPCVDVFAPGEALLCDTTTCRTETGTSEAAAFTSGVLALYLGRGASISDLKNESDAVIRLGNAPDRYPLVKAPSEKP
jgi:subtilisin family serine protease